MALAALPWLVLGWTNLPTKQGMKVPALPANVRSILIFTGGKESALYPCGCQSLQNGGIAQEAYVIKLLLDKTKAVNSPTFIADWTASTFDANQQELLTAYAKLVGVNALALNHGTAFAPKQSEWKKGRLTLLSGAVPVCVSFAMSDTPYAQVPHGPIHLSGESQVVQLPKLQRGEVLVAFETEDQGKFSLEMKAVETTSKDATDPAVDVLIKKFVADEVAHQERVTASLTDERTDSELCASCHQSAYESWRTSNHSGAIQTLKDRNKLIPECIRCHQDKLRLTPSPNNSVECTSCHSGALAHLAAPKEHKLPKVGSAATCARCHTDETDPKFSFQVRLKTLAHGGHP